MQHELRAFVLFAAGCGSAWVEGGSDQSESVMFETSAAVYGPQDLSHSSSDTALDARRKQLVSAASFMGRADHFGCCQGHR